MDFHEELSQLGEKEGLKGRKLSKAVESFTWNITVLKVPCRQPAVHSDTGSVKTQERTTADLISREIYRLGNFCCCLYH